MVLLNQFMIRFFDKAGLRILRDAPSRLTAALHNAVIGQPDHLLYVGCGIGDDFLCSAVAHELKLRGTNRVVMFSRHRELFRHNPDVDAVYDFSAKTFGRLKFRGVTATHPCYFHYDPATDRETYPEKIILAMCRKAGITGSISLRPYFTLLSAEKKTGRLFAPQIVIQSAGLGLMKNKDWLVERYQAVADALGGRARIIQLGLASDPPIRNALDLRGKTTLRESAAILANARLFVGQVGFLMHLARAVECRSVIVYGGREDPAITGYIANENVVGKTACSPCLFRNRCDYDRECMKMVSVEMVLAAAARAWERHGEALPVEAVGV
jgi:ADP-heptose:LPS heptosyltransferase